ncbi:MAG: asparagine synthase (glutamine-hydrolyzing) [Deltaproteobacteria bacterium]|jgi:asparagine synthase (glutamine-hydrolysing)
MCGISGIVVPEGERLPREILRAMNTTLARRGPDDEGYFFDEEGGCGLGHRRLSIIDLGGGHQPLYGADGAVQIVANGEIYNFVELRERLLAKGHVFVTNSDCETIAHGWVEWGEALFEKLIGMFAIAIWDRRTRRLILARDRMGQKPLYYGWVGEKKDTLLFASELKAIVRHPGFRRDVRPSALAQYLTYECLPEDEAIYADAAKLQPGTYAVFDRTAGRMRHETYWQMAFSGTPEEAAIAGKNEDEIATMLQNRIREGVRRRLISDVPLGVLLSGGIDSSTIVAAMADLVPPDRIQTFSISFEDASFDESSHAQRVAEHIGTVHHTERLSPQVMIDILPEVADTMCEPLGDGSIIPTYLLSRFVRERVTVALGGDGGDELFLGYPTFQADRVARYLDRALDTSAQKNLGSAARQLADLLPVSRKNFSFDFKVKKFLEGIGYEPDFRHQAWMGSFMPDQLAAVLHEDVREGALFESPYATIAKFRERSGARDADDQAVYQYARLYLTGCVLTKVDRASMAHGLEVRAPLLDADLVQLATAIPGSMKVSGMTTKHILKKAARPWLPDEIIDRPKKGFGVPIGMWLRGPLKDMAAGLLAAPKIAKEGLLDPTEVTRLFDEHQRGEADHRKPLWTILALELWHERYGPGTRAAPVAPPRDSSSVVARAVG